ncbi:hypothetical protein BGW80DRAFT_1353620 [Lactifluus volemus]|nr:hypothetical protein BGW80DRAFT_1353620 [Lactifluus volemus]
MCSASVFVTLYTMPLHELNCAPTIYYIRPPGCIFVGLFLCTRGSYARVLYCLLYLIDYRTPSVQTSFSSRSYVSHSFPDHSGFFWHIFFQFPANLRCRLDQV